MVRDTFQAGMQLTTHWMKVLLMMKTRGRMILDRRPSVLVKSTRWWKKGYFVDGKAHAPGAEIVPEPDSNEAIMYEDFFVAGLRMPPHPTLADILLMFQAQMH
jgi:hypothetical protein